MTSSIWKPHLIVPSTVPERRDSVNVGDDVCIACNRTLKDENTDGFHPFWVAYGGTELCASSPLNCDDGFHYHGLEDEHYFHDQNEAEDAGAEWDGQNEEEGYRCYEGRHLTASDLEAITRPREAGEDLIEDIIDFYADYKRDASNHCSTLNCRNAKCHNCNPQPYCGIHVPCINSLSCVNCNTPLHNVELDWDDDGEDVPLNELPKTLHVPARVLHAEWLTQRYPDSAMLSRAFGHHPEEYAATNIRRHILEEAMDLSGHDLQGYFDYVDIRPICRNSTCISYNHPL